jgi:hypothetical protein
MAVESPIARYMADLGQRLAVGAAEKAAILEEAQAHLEEHTLHLQDAGVEREEAERQAVQAFGRAREVAGRLSRVHPVSWRGWRFVRSVGVGVVATWAIWTGGCFPILANDAYAHAISVGYGDDFVTADLPMRMFDSSTPVGSGAYEAFQIAGWGWLLALLLLYCLLPFVWGLRARRWWAPGLAYGLGTWIGAPAGLLLFLRWSDPFWPADLRIVGTFVLALLPLALLAGLAASI